MNTKKLVLSIAGVLAIVSAANAADTDKIKAACQASDKTLWVENNQVCIPKNPCKDSKFEQYCNRRFADVQVRGYAGHKLTDVRMKTHSDYKLLVETYAKGHGLSCVPVDTDPNIVGQDYVICMGNDVMVFEFDDINNGGSIHTTEKDNAYNKEFNLLLCESIGGAYNSEDGICKGIGEPQCTQMGQLIEKYEYHFDKPYDSSEHMGANAWAYWVPGGCQMYK